MRVLRQKLFFASTIEEIDVQLDKFLIAKNICVGNYIDLKLWKRNIYQVALIFAEFIEN